MKRVKNGIKEGYQRLLVSAGLLSVGSVSSADGSSHVIPISTDEVPADNQSFSQSIIHVFQKDIIPVIEIFSATWILYTGVATMVNGVKEAQEKQRFDPLKNAIIKTVIVVVVGGLLVYLIDQLRSYTFTD
jgi:hypothetical protein